MFASLPALPADALVLSAPSQPVAAPPAVAPTATPEPAEETHLVWYGWQTLLVDFASVSLEFMALAENGEASYPLAVAGALGYLVGSPALHVGHHRPTIGVIDFSLRLGLPILLGGLGAATGSKERPANCDEFCWSQSTSDTLVGVLLGLGTSMLIDAFALTWDLVPAARPPEARAAGIRWAPTAMPTRGGALAGVGGTF